VEDDVVAVGVDPESNGGRRFSRGLAEWATVRLEYGPLLLE
jgi:hypothetical protein